MATLRVLPTNPVPVFMPSVSQSAATTIEWDTQSSSIVARVFMAVNGGPFARFDAADPAPATRRGSKALTVKLEDQYLLELRREGTGQVIANLVVVTREAVALQDMIDFVKPKIPSRQAINGLRVEPGVESVHVRFRTRQATNPLVTVKHAEDRSLAGARWGPKGTAHDYDIPIGGDPTPQREIYRLAIEAQSTEGVATIATAGALFLTGSRRAEIFFDRLRVHKDGDPGFYMGDGDFSWNMGAGELGSKAAFGIVGAGGPMGDGEQVELARSVLADPAPAGIWVQATGLESDSGFGSTIIGSIALGHAPEGVRQQNLDGDGEIIAVTRWFDLAALPGPLDEFPFTLETGRRVFAASVECRLRVETQPGAVIEPQVTKRRGSPVYVPHEVARLEPGGSLRTSATTTLNRGPNGELYRAEQAADARVAQWVELGPAVAGPVTVVRIADGDEVFALGARGEAQRLVDGAWKSLGGGFVGELAAAVAGSEAHLFGLDRGGAVLRRHSDRDWERVGDGVAGDLAALTSGDRVVLAARGTDGAVLYRTLDDSAWTRLGDAPTGALFAAATGEGLAFAVVREDETIALAVASGPPERLDWREAGDITALLDRRYSLAGIFKAGVDDMPVRPYAALSRSRAF